MNEEPIFSDRLIPLLALPGVLLSVALFGLDWLDGRASSSYGLWLFVTASLAICSVVLLAIPLHIAAKYQILRGKGLTTTKAIWRMTIGLSMITIGWFIFQAGGKAFGWLFEGSRFYLIAGIAFVLFLLIYFPYSLYSERKERRRLNVINGKPSRCTEIVKK